MTQRIISKDAAASLPKNEFFKDKDSENFKKNDI